jgi:hypothetical protein
MYATASRDIVRSERLDRIDLALCGLADLVAEMRHELGVDRARLNDADAHTPLSPLARSCAGAAVACLGLSAVGRAPLLLGLTLVVLFGIPWVFAVGYRLQSATAIDVT